MPLYSYKCYHCGLLTEQRQSVAERNRPIDCECGKPAGRIFEPTANLLVPEHFRHTASDFLPEKGDPAWKGMGRDSSQTHAKPVRTLKDYVEANG